MPSKLRVAECYSLARKRFSLAGCERRRIIEVDPVKAEVGEFGASGESFDEAAGRLGREGPVTRPQIFFQEASIDQLWRSFAGA